MNNVIKALFATALLGASTLSSAAIVLVNNSNLVSIPGISTFQTFGDTMDGMSVTAVFDNGVFSETLAWADTGPQSGGVSGTGWNLNLSGDTFLANWNFTNNTNFTLTSLVLDGSTGLTLFDRSTTDAGGSTPGSAAGVTFSDTPPVAIMAVYSDLVQIGANAPVGDIYQTLTIDFLDVATGLGTRSDFSFVQDTDNDIRIQQVPAPAMLGLLGLGLIGIGAVRRFSA